MLEVLMAFFVLAVLVVGSVGAASIMRALQSIEERLDSLEDGHAVMLARQAKSMPEILKGDVDALAAALHVHRASTRQELGRLWAKWGGRRLAEDAERDDEAATPIGQHVIDAEHAGLVAFQAQR